MENGQLQKHAQVLKHQMSMQNIKHDQLSQLIHLNEKYKEREAATQERQGRSRAEIQNVMKQL